MQKHNMYQEDHPLIQKTLSGDKQAERQLYDRYERYWFRLCLRYGRNKVEAEDILQEGLVCIFRDLKQFDSQKGQFSTWSNRVLVNAALRYLKKQQWQSSFDNLSQSGAKTHGATHIIEGLTAKELTEVIQQLPTGYRVIFNMYEIEGFSHKEIAATLNISIGTSKSQLSKAKKALRQAIEILF